MLFLCKRQVVDFFNFLLKSAYAAEAVLQIIDFALFSATFLLCSHGCRVLA